jgi:hypothetical protein
MKLLAEELDINKIGCLAHIINLMVRKAFDCFGKIKNTNQATDELYLSTEEDQEEEEEDFENNRENPYASSKDNLEVLNNLFHDIRKIVGLINSSTCILDQLMALQMDNKLVPIQDVVTRWNSLYLMIERFIILFDKIKVVLNRTTQQKYEIHRTRINLMSREVILLLKACVSVLKPFYKVTVILSGQKYTTVSIVLHSCYYLRWKLLQEQTESVAKSLQKKLSASFNFYVDKYEIFTNNFLCSATYFNPEYRDMKFCETAEKKRVQKAAELYMLEYFKKAGTTENQYTNSTESDESGESDDSFKQKTPRSKVTTAELSSKCFLEMSKTDSTLTVDKFWCAHERQFPNLSKFVRMVLSPPATSVPSERVFSGASNQIWARRNRLAAASVEKLMFLLNNLNDDISLLNLSE